MWRCFYIPAVSDFPIEPVLESDVFFEHEYSQVAVMGVAVLRTWARPLREAPTTSQSNLDSFRGVATGCLLSVLIWSIGAVILLAS
jgi:hypothetical protein